MMQAGPEPLFVTEHMIDPDFAEPFIEIEEERLEPVPHRYVHGGFAGTEARFSFYFPPAGQYQGRFFHNTYPMAVMSDIGPFPIEFEVATGDLGFTVDSGATYVQTNNGGAFRVAGTDPAIAAYRVNAAAAKFSRVVAARIYGDHRPYGYLFGGSGGAYQTMGAAEHTDGVWDGFVPFVPGCNHAIPSMFTARMHALRELRRRNRYPGIAEAMEPGGSGDPYAGLDAAEAAAFREVSLMGYPLRGWYGHEAMDSGYFANISGMIPAIDPAYAADFWSQPGYLGSDPAAPIHGDRFSFETTVASVSEGFPKVIELADLPDRDCQDAHLVVLDGAAAGASLPITRPQGRHIPLIATADPAQAGAIRPGDRVRIDNAWTLALETYHRHQVPPETVYLGWNQFRDGAGVPLYPQRPVLVGPFGTANSAGGVLTGNTHGKVLMLACLLDIDAYPWQADWYRGEVEARHGPDYARNFALWFIDNAHHENPMTPLQRTHAVSYGGALQQALRDLARWIEQGIRPAAMQYQLRDAQVIVPETAAERGGVQPTIALTANGGNVAHVGAGEAVSLAARIDVPAGAGTIVSAEWDFDGSGNFGNVASIGEPSASIDLSARHAWSEPGTHYAVLRVAAQREGRRDTPYGLVRNIARVRVVVA